MKWKTYTSPIDGEIAIKNIFDHIVMHSEKNKQNQSSQPNISQETIDKILK